MKLANQLIFKALLFGEDLGWATYQFFSDLLRGGKSSFF
jgi:hypothetical protein